MRERRRLPLLRRRRGVVSHSNKEYAKPETGAHVNIAEAVISQVQRALVGVYHNLGPSCGGAGGADMVDV